MSMITTTIPAIPIIPITQTPHLPNTHLGNTGRGDFNLAEGIMRFNDVRYNIATYDDRIRGWIETGINIDRIPYGTQPTFSRTIEEPRFWSGRYGPMIINKMTIKHIINCLKRCKRDNWRTEFIPKFEEEIKLRGAQSEQRKKQAIEDRMLRDRVQDNFRYVEQQMEL